MILRFSSAVLILYALGFALFAVSLGKVGGDKDTDAIVVLTGGKGRIERGVDMLADKRARRMLVSGADPAVRKGDLKDRVPKAQRKLLDCCVDLESTSVDTRSNADESAKWLKAKGYDSVRLVTSDYHMRRAKWEFRHVLGPDFRIVGDAVRTEPNLMTLFGEYNNYLLRRASVWADL